MKKAKHPVMTGIATGAVLGTAAYMLANKDGAQSKMIKRNTGKALRTVGSLMEEMSSMIK